MKPRAKLPKSNGGAPKSGSKNKKMTATNKKGLSTTSTTLPHDAESIVAAGELVAAQHQQQERDTSATGIANGQGQGEGEEAVVSVAAAENENELDGTQKRARMLQRHKQELRDVKKVRGKSKAEVKAMEQELRLKQQTELHTLDHELAVQRPRPVPKPLATTTTRHQCDDDEESEDDNTTNKDQQEKQQSHARQKPSRAARRRQKREGEEREREQRIENERKNAGPSAKALETRRLLEKLCPKGFRIVEVAADGNCLYSAVGDQVKRLGLDGPTSIADLRRATADYIAQNPDDFLPFLIAEEELPPDGLHKYCDEVKRDGVWGGQIELRALAQCLHAPIVVHSADAPEMRMGEEFMPSGGGGHPLQLSFHRHYYALGEHYNSVVLRQVEGNDDSDNQNDDEVEA